ncbi:MAG: hypothetical protein K6G27_03980 [Lachnospiraceae bacterium]|nr:hypothetical protein [Lachnospiraceae bacterium]
MNGSDPFTIRLSVILSLLFSMSLAVFNPALPFLANSETYADLGSTLDEIITQARTQYICGQIDEEGLKAAAEQWLSQGGQKVIDEVNAQRK